MRSHAGFNKLIAGLFVIGAIGGLYFQFASHKFLNNDTLAYINIAERYAAGDWPHAINGYWSPMYSWLLCICHLTGLPLLQSCYVINFIAAALNLYVISALARRYLTHRMFYGAFGLYALLILLHSAMSTLTPDLLAAFFCFWFLYLVTDKDFAFNNRLPWLAGIAAACAYFAKSYNFLPLNMALATWLLAALIKKKAAGKKQPLPLIKTYGIFLFLSLLWIGALSIHENKLTFSTAGRFNHNLVGPYYRNAFPTNTQLLAPPFEEAYSIHTNPASLLNDYDWSPFNDTRSFHHQLLLIINSIRGLIIIPDGTGAKWLVLLASLLLIFINRKKIHTNTASGIHKVVFFCLCYPLLYLPLFVIDRYILVYIVLFHLLLFFIAQTAGVFINKKIFVPAVAIIIAFSIVPFVRAAQRKLTHSTAEYAYYSNFYRRLPQFSFLQNQAIASDRYSMVEATQLCYYFNCRYYCTSTDYQYQSLKKFKIRFLIAKNDLSSFSFLHERGKILLEKETVYVYEIR
ncbi:hypothetical protein [Niastella populi]|uniref:Glycosyltransferase RgtA/B/C/D-like domain-containing protein n=1 Tax=Niastella populi TaxID=550983 RepID=A0A1V9EIP7_9BACT|nr:hypothetical protein [Niastella populi]OQP45755.1 hypothetical protein A4R26_09715 [Niastella populi]